MRRFMPAALGVMFAAVPLLPSFIALTKVAFPGVSLVPSVVTYSVLGGCAVLAIYALTMLARYPLRGSQPLLLPVLSIFGAGLLAGLAGFDPAAGLLFTLIGGLGIVWHCAIMRFYGDRYAALTIYWAYMLSCAVACAIAIAMVVTRHPAGQYALQHGRATGTFILPGELAGYLIALLPPAYALGCVAAQRALRVLGWIVLAIGLAALALTYSRAGWMGFAAAFAFLLAMRTRRGVGAAAIVAAAGAVAVLVLFNAHHNPSEDYTRLSIWQAAIQVADRFPLTGVGPFNFSRLYALVRAPDGDPTAFHAHSIYLTFFVEFGIVGIATVAWTFYRFVGELRLRLACAPSPQAFLALSVAAGLVGVAVQGLIDTVSVVIFGLWMPTMALALAAAKGGEPSPTVER
ncbi:MAG TPA: O-antigen ligase family protein [Candidatus Binatia bacterium]|nr:O-antigen ligase family protein [Candidatus Binatia bacterium]